MKKKIAKLMFIMSFLPYFIIIVISLYYAVVGYEQIESLRIPDTMVAEYETQRIYGINAFLTVFSFQVLVFGSVIPILWIVIVYQIIYVVMKKLGKVKEKK